MGDLADSPPCPAPPAARTGRVPQPAPAASSSRRLSVWRLCCAGLLLAVVVSPAVAQAAARSVGTTAPTTTTASIDLSQYPTQYAANDGYVYTGRRAQVLHHLHDRFAARATTYAGHAECPTCSADLWTPGAWGGRDNTGMQSMNDLAKYIRAHASELGIKYVVWNQRISSGDKWRKMKDQGSLTANHKDHVHITFLKRFK
jgi:hypothetical protein